MSDLTFSVDGHGGLALTSGYNPPLTLGTFDKQTVTHVLVGYNPDGSLITRGTANPINDYWPSPVYKHDVCGRVVLRILLFTPAFWASQYGTLLIGAVGLIAGSWLLWRRTHPPESPSLTQ